MTTDFETNVLYLSSLLTEIDKYKPFWNRLKPILHENKIKYKLIENTRDIWCRDYMPVQIEKDKFIQFRYEPSYLDKEPNLRSDPKDVCKANGFEPIFSNINLDGGNVVNWDNKAIISDRIFDENPEYSDKTKLIHELENLLDVEVIIIPQIKSDMTGHADGMVRFVDENTILGNDIEQEFKYWRVGMKKVLKNHHLDYVNIPFFENKKINRKNPDNAIGCYVNYLEVGNLILLPIFEIDGNRDRDVYELFKLTFPERIIETINCNEIGYKGGLLNCTTWTTKETIL